MWSEPLTFNVAVFFLGSLGGLSMTLNAEQYEYSSGLHSTAGFHVYISAKDDTNVLIENRGNFVSVGTQTSLAIKQTKVLSDNEAAY